jgi:hypothetical protein
MREDKHMPIQSPFLLERQYSNNNCKLLIYAFCIRNENTGRSTCDEIQRAEDKQSSHAVDNG